MAIPPLIGNEVGVFAWYAHGLAFTDGEYADLHAQLSNKSSESPTEYYDGTYAYGGNTYNARVRKDGYILAWLPHDTEAVYDFDYSGDPPLSYRAIQAIMGAAGVSGFDFAKCYYYNCNYTNTTKVRWFGKNWTGVHGSTTFSFTLPSGLQYHYVKQKNYCHVPYDSPTCSGGTAENIKDVLTDPEFSPIGTENTVTLMEQTIGACYGGAVLVNDITVLNTGVGGSYPGTKKAWSVIIAFVSPV